MMSGLSSSLTALNAYGKKLGVAANNIANADSKGFKKSRVEFQDSSPGGQGVEARVEPVSAPGAQFSENTPQGPRLVEQSNVDYGDEMLSLIMAQRGIEANAHAVRTQDQALGNLVNLIS
jgi:flagellar hook protein FlgE